MARFYGSRSWPLLEHMLLFLGLIRSLTGERLLLSQRRFPLKKRNQSRCEKNLLKSFFRPVSMPPLSRQFLI